MDFCHFEWWVTTKRNHFATALMSISVGHTQHTIECHTSTVHQSFFCKQRTTCINLIHYPLFAMTDLGQGRLQEPQLQRRRPSTGLNWSLQRSMEQVNRGAGSDFIGQPLTFPSIPQPAGINTHVPHSSSLQYYNIHWKMGEFQPNE